MTRCIFKVQWIYLVKIWMREKTVTCTIAHNSDILQVSDPFVEQGLTRSTGLHGLSAGVGLEGRGEGQTHKEAAPCGRRKR